MAKSILDKISKDIVKNMKLYRLGVFGNSSLELVELKAGEDYPAHYHKRSKSIFYMIIGDGLIILNKKKHKYKAGKTHKIPKGMKHGFKPKTDTLFLSIQTPPIKDRKTDVEDIYF